MQWQLRMPRCYAVSASSFQHSKALMFACVQQAQLPDSGGTARWDLASCSCLDAAAALPHIATSVIKIGGLLQQEQALFLRVGSI